MRKSSQKRVSILATRGTYSTSRDPGKWQILLEKAKIDSFRRLVRTPARANQTDFLVVAEVLGNSLQHLQANRPEAEKLYQIATGLLSKRARGEFDVFLCHNSEDKPSIRSIYKELTHRGILPWLDEMELPPGSSWQRVLAKQIGNIKSVVVFIGRSGQGPWQILEMESFLQEFVQRKCRVIPVILKECNKRPRLPAFLKNFTWVDLRAKYPDPMELLVWGITGVRPFGMLQHNL